ncbi:putative bifunctional diguanylate cyclase/phosphodiesterase [Devosia beringensis]|uniref:putative bifunctional diguanylate cyclase/phosphodiesterase n=1 Tax=Devosia beringensis TaxID=2657486 RepID=UPI00186BA132|nr:EAL domain-containing protein [Devosia beringensis]
MRAFVRVTSMIALLAALWGAAAAGWFAPVDNALQGWRFTASSRPVSGDMVFVEIDSVSLQSVGVWPWPRTVHAGLLDRLVELGALDIVFDVDFSAASTPQADAAFEAALQRAGGYAFLAAFQQTLSDGRTLLSRPLPRFEAHASAVLVNVDGDGTGLLESLPAALNSIPSVAHALVPAAGAAAPSIIIDYGIDLSTVRRISAAAVLAGAVDPALVAGKQVIIGASAIELRDFFRVPRFGVIDGAMVQIAATETLKADRALTDWGSMPAGLSGLLLLSALLLARRHRSLPQRALAVLAASLAAEVGAWLALSLGGLLVDTAVFHAIAAGALALCFLDERARRWQQTRRQQARLAYLARHDEVSGALSRHAIMEALSETAGRQAVVVVKLLRLDAINASLGHGVFDQVTGEITARLVGLGNGLPARLGSDVFAFAVPPDSGPDGLSAAIAASAALLEQPYHIDGHTIVLGVVFGSAVRTLPEQSVNQILQDAEVALALAESGQQRSVLYQPSHGQQIRDRRLRDLALRQALARDEFYLLYQPQIELSSGRTVGLEALIRWCNAELGEVSPADFIPLAEETGLIVQIGEWILLEACRQAAQWNWQGRMSVNVSPAQFAQGDLVASVRRALQESGLPPHRLDIEITESIHVADSPANLRILNQLSAMGVCLAMDDFGTGFSSLSYLTSLPIDKIKIDQSFVRNLPDAQSEAIIETTVVMARRLGKIVIAEGVETEQQRAYLAGIGCDIGQGYLFGRPSLAAELGPQQAPAA